MSIRKQVVRHVFNLRASRVLREHAPSLRGAMRRWRGLVIAPACMGVGLAIAATPSTATHKGMTWTLLDAQGSFSHVGFDDHEHSNPLFGDTGPHVSLPVLCLRQDGRAAPSSIALDKYSGWAQGEIRLTGPVAGATLTSRTVADNLCSGKFGEGFRMAEFYDGGGGWTFWAEGSISDASRFWVANDSQPANPWNVDRVE